MKRRKVLNTAAVGLGSAALAACAGQQQPGGSATSADLPNVRWRMATSWPASLDVLYGGATAMAERLRELSGGRFDITPYAGGELVPGTQVLDGVQSGAVEKRPSTASTGISGWWRLPLATRAPRWAAGSSGPWSRSRTSRV